MIDLRRPLSLERNDIRASLSVITGICVFAGFIHKDTVGQILAFAALAFTGLIMFLSVKDFRALLHVLAIIPVRIKIIPWILAGLLFGGALGVMYNVIIEDYLFPSGLTGFVLLAPLIGMMEEIVYRGFVQGKLASSGVLISIVAGSVGHTLYKYILLRTLPLETGINFTSLVLLTFSVGTFLGILRHYSKNILPAALAHGLFDILVYGGAAAAPVWIWG